MTANQSATAKAGVQLNKRPDADAARIVHARAEGGCVLLLRYGRLEPVSRWEAVETLVALGGSPFPSSQERARQIRAALRETMQ